MSEYTVGTCSWPDSYSTLTGRAADGLLWWTQTSLIQYNANPFPRTRWWTDTAGAVVRTETIRLMPRGGQNGVRNMSEVWGAEHLQSGAWRNSATSVYTPEVYRAEPGSLDFYPQGALLNPDGSPLATQGLVQCSYWRAADGTEWLVGRSRSGQANGTTPEQTFSIWRGTLAGPALAQLTDTRLFSLWLGCDGQVWSWRNSGASLSPRYLCRHDPTTLAIVEEWGPVGQANTSTYAFGFRFADKFAVANLSLSPMVYELFRLEPDYTLTLVESAVVSTLDTGFARPAGRALLVRGTWVGESADTLCWAPPPADHLPGPPPNPRPIWPFRPDWSRPPLERLEWHTRVATRRDGSEQRAAIRRHPNRTFEWEALLPQGLAGLADNYLRWGQGRDWIVPNWTDPDRLTAPAAAGSTRLVCNPGSHYWLNWVVLWRDERDYEAREIASVDAGGIDLADPLGQAWPQGARLYPGYWMRLEDTVSAGRLTAGLARLLLRWRVTPNYAVGALGGEPLYRGLPVVELRHDWSATLESTHLRDWDEFAPPSALSAVRWDPSGQGVERWVLRLAVSGRAAVNALRAWLHARQGRLGAVWLPTLRADLRLAAPLAAGAVGLTVQADGAELFADCAPGRADLRLLDLATGTAHYRRVVAVERAGDTETLTLDAPLPVTLAAALLSWLYPARLDSDGIELSWQTAELVRVSLPWQTLLMGCEPDPEPDPDLDPEPEG
jgi:hypothetical protein